MGSNGPQLLLVYYTKRGGYVCVSVCVISRAVFGSAAKARPVLEMAGRCARQHAAGILNLPKNRVAIFLNGPFFELRKFRDQFWKWQAIASRKLWYNFKIYVNQGCHFLRCVILGAIKGPKAPTGLRAFRPDNALQDQGPLGPEALRRS